MADKPKTKTLTLKGEESNLHDTNPIWDKYYDEWRFLNAAYEGVRALVAWGALYRHERESEINYQNRLKSAYGFSYSKSIVDILNSYLFKKEFPSEIPKPLTADTQWKQFQKDCDLEGTTFDNFFVDEQRNASILGHVGLFVDKPQQEAPNRAEEIEQNIYPYVVAYKPMAILDWRVERDTYGRKKLVYVKLLDDDDRYRVWTPETWEVWEIQNTKTGERLGVTELTRVGDQPEKSEIQGKGTTAVKIDSGDNTLGEIPLVMLYNQRSNIDREVGVSDITDISRVDAGIIRNLSQIEEIIDYAAFPMMRKPMKESGAAADAKDEVGTVAVLEFDPDKPESKPDWLDASVSGPIKATLDVIAHKVTEAYRSSNIGGMAATEISKSAKSGVALKTEFQLLNSKLVKKGKNVAKAKYDVVRYWLMWQDEWEKYKDDIIFDHIKTFEIEDLASDLENVLTSSVIVTGSDKYKQEMQKLVVRMVLPSLDEEKLAEIDKEIEEGTFGLEEFFAGGGGQEPPPEEVPTREEVLDDEGKPTIPKKPSKPNLKSVPGGASK